MLGLAALACGDGAVVGASLSFEPLFELGADSLACQDVGGVTALQVDLRDATGVASRPGFPQRFPCGPVTVTGFEGAGVLELRALGELDGDPEATLFRTRQEVALPSELGAIRLRPEVAFLELDWNFGERGLEPCTLEVERVEVRVNTQGASAPAFSRSLGCTGGPIRVPNPLALSPYTVDVRAITGAFTLYAATARRVFDRGPNQYTAVLSPRGAQVLMDWRFSLEGERIDACDDPRVDAMQISASLQGLVLERNMLIPDGSAPAAEMLNCSEGRPAAFPFARFTVGRELELELRAAGAHRYRAVRRFTMPDRDVLLEGIDMVAVGDAEAPIQVSNMDCDISSAEGLSVSAEGSGGLRFMIDLDRNARTVTFGDLPYGPYAVTLARTPTLQACPPATMMRQVRSTTESWDVLTL